MTITKYHDPGISRFVQIDIKYNGEKESITSQNKYVYTLNNPYKYVDKDGNRPFKLPFTICPPKPPFKNKLVKIPPEVKKEIAKKEQAIPKVEIGICNKIFRFIETKLGGFINEIF